MSIIWGFIGGVFSTIFSGLAWTFMMLAIGAGVGLAAGIAATMFRGLQGIGAAACIGAVMMVGVSASTIVSTKQDCKTAVQVAQLESQKAKLENDLKLLKEFRVQDAIQAAADAKALAENEQTFAKLKEIIASHEGDPFCGAFADEMEELGKLK